ncbi:MAG: phenylalanine--tRNA ligase subunit alpha [Candidatus Micrarchaeales archaeon]
MHRYEIAVLKSLEHGKPLQLNQLVEKSGVAKDGVLWSIENLSKIGAILVKKNDSEEVRLTDEGKEYAISHLPETELIKKLEKKSLDIKTINDNKSRIGLQWAKSKQLIEIDKGMLVLTAKGILALSKGISEEYVLVKLKEDPKLYPTFAKENKVETDNLLKRKLITVEKRNEIENVAITQKGRDLIVAETKHEAEIDSVDRKMLSNRSWKGKKFKKYDVNVPVESEIPARMHPLRRTINDVKTAYTNMGFKEVSGPIVIPAFWNFDTLFTPQDHPAREAQDTFYVSNPSELGIDRKEIVSKVKSEHEAAWHDDWLEKVAMQPVLRTQMTTVSIQELYNLNKYKDYKLPLKLFSVGRVFRNENIDYKHLTDFYQTDGLIVGENLTMANLFDTLIKIYKELGLKVRFKPAYFPFVEPGAEMQAFYEERGEWIEIAGCGMLRREITGIARKNITVLAWGVSVERLLLIKDQQVERISDLYNNGIGWIRSKRT